MCFACRTDTVAARSSHIVPSQHITQESTVSFRVSAVEKKVHTSDHRQMLFLQIGFVQGHCRC
jgi:hypothetical protein